MKRTMCGIVLAGLALAALGGCESQSGGVADWNFHPMELDPVGRVVPVSDGTVMIDAAAVNRHEVARWEFLWKPPAEDGQGDMPVDDGGVAGGE